MVAQPAQKVYVLDDDSAKVQVEEARPTRRIRSLSTSQIKRSSLMDDLVGQVEVEDNLEVMLDVKQEILKMKEQFDDLVKVLHANKQNGDNCCAEGSLATLDFGILSQCSKLRDDQLISRLARPAVPAR